jgi:hypothetical protein
MLQQAMKITPIPAYTTDFQRRIRPMMPLGNPHHIILPPIDETLASPDEVPLIDKH